MPVDKVEALRKTALFGELTAAESQALAETALEQKLRKGEILFLAGEPAKGMYVIAAGAVRAYRVGADGREQVIHIEREGAIVGELPVFDGGAYPSNVAGEEDTVLLYIGTREVQRILTDHPQIAVAALRSMARRLRKCASLVETLSLHDVDRRLARLLLEEARLRGEPGGIATEFDFAMTHQQIATRIGTVREVVSRAFGRLQQAGLVQTHGKKLVIMDEKALTSYVEGG
jgi:CRP/FNR family transcriptional regulator